jgi:ribose 5-phosphate isomerase B
MKVYLAADHAGFKLKEGLKFILQAKGYEVGDYGADTLDPSDDYPDFIYPAVLAVANDPDSRGIVMGFSGQGEAMLANKVSGIRAVVYYGKPSIVSEVGRERTDKPKDIVELSREDNNSNVLALGAGFVSLQEAEEVVIRWLETPYGGEERHARRLKKVAEIEKKSFSAEGGSASGGK